MVPSLPISTSDLVSSTASSRSLSRVRSCSLSVSLAQEREERERSVSIGPGKKRALNREVSMSRTFKPKPKPKISKTTSDLQSNGYGKLQTGKTEIILVEDTPQKPRVVGRKASLSNCDPTSSNDVFSTRQSNQGLFGTRTDKTDDDDAWMLDSSPDVFLLQPGRKAGGNSDDKYETVIFQTPSRRPRRRD